MIISISYLLSIDVVAAAVVAVFAVKTHQIMKLLSFF